MIAPRSICALTFATVQLERRSAPSSDLLRFQDGKIVELIELAGTAQINAMGGLGALVQLGGLEPPTSCSTDRRSNQLSYNCILASRALGRP